MRKSSLRAAQLHRIQILLNSQSVIFLVPTFCFHKNLCSSQNFSLLVDVRTVCLKVRHQNFSFLMQLENCLICTIIVSNLRIQTKEARKPFLYRIYRKHQCSWLLSIGKMSEVLWCLCCNSKTAETLIFKLKFKFVSYFYPSPKMCKYLSYL